LTVQSSHSEKEKNIAQKPKVWYPSYDCTKDGAIGKGYTHDYSK